jgi:hypothetical protein
VLRAADCARAPCVGPIIASCCEAPVEENAKESLTQRRGATGRAVEEDAQQLAMDPTPYTTVDPPCA